jgi:ABC-type dipeptide/oligopeptide/nickel transport system permease component
MSIGALILRRVLWTIPLVVFVTLATFALLRGAGGSPFEPPEGFGGVPEAYEQVLRDFYHLDEPWLVEYAYYLKNIVSLEFGPSLVQRDLMVEDVIRHSFPVTLELVALAAAWAVPIGIAAGVYSATHRNRPLDYLLTGTATVFLVVPVFFVAYLAGHYLVREWQVLPFGWDDRSTRAVASLILALAPIGYVARLVRGAVVQTLEEDYVRTAAAKGLRRGRILWVHVLRNSLTPFLSAAVPMLALLVTGAFFVEDAFRIPGASAFFAVAARSRDYPLLMGLTVSLAVVILLVNALADVLLALLDPRVREPSR